MNTKKDNNIRIGIMVAVILIIGTVFYFQLLQIQVVNAEYYQDMIQGVRTSTQPVKAVRGNITDRNGIALAENTMEYNVVFQRAVLPYRQENEIILKTIQLFEKGNEKWIDNLPITKKEPFRYIPDMESQVEALIKDKGFHSYTSAEDIIYWLTEEYHLEDYPPETARQIIGIRWEMERKDFSNAIPYVFAKDVSNNMIITIKEHSYELTGVDVEANPIRSYPVEDLAVHIIGQTGPLYREEYNQLMEEGLIFDKDKEPYDSRGYTLDDSLGKSGIERATEEYLRGDNGLKEIHLDASGNVVAEGESIAPISGNTVSLTIDANMQRAAQEYLESQIKHLNETQPKGRGGDAHSGAVVVLNPKTGEILATATYPSYTITEYKENYTQLAQQEGNPLLNRAIQGSYTPGSIYKPVVALTGLKTGVITPSTVFNCGGRYYYYAPYTPKCLSTHGGISLYNALGWSCNIFFYETGRLSGIDEIDHVAQSLGLGEPTGIEIDEAIGQRSNPQIKEARGGGEWYGADTIQTAIGQFDNSFSPLQMANYAATIANRGTRMKLTLIRDVKDFFGNEIVKPFTPEIAYLIDDISQQNFEDTIQGMINATTGSSGGTFSGYPVSVASKTGTPQVTEDIVNSTFVCFAPADDPELAIAVVIEEGWQGYTGAPVAKAIFDDYFNVEHRGGVASGPQRLKDYRNSDIYGENRPDGYSDIDMVFPQFAQNFPPKTSND